MSSKEIISDLNFGEKNPIQISISSYGIMFLLLSLAIGLIGLQLNEPLLYFPGIVPPLVFVLFILRLSIAKGLEIEVQVTIPSTQVKAKSFVTIEIDFIAKAKIRGLVSIETSEGLFPVVKPEHSFISLNNDERSTDTFVFFAPRRGKERVKSLSFQYNGIIGFFYAEKTVEINQDLIILPEPQRIQLPWNLKQRIMDQFVSQITVMIKGRGTEFLALKDFEYGDELRHISWKATAKFNKLISKEFEEPMQLRFLIVVDGSLSMAGPKLEFALSAAIELTTVIRRSEFTVTILVHGDHTYRNIKITSSSGALQSLAIELHNVIPLGTGLNYDTLYDTITTKKLTNSVVIFISDPELPKNIIQEGLVKIRRYSQRVFFLSCFTPGFGALSYSEVRDELVDSVYQYNYRREIIEKKILREYEKQEAQIIVAVKSSNSNYHSLETYNTNVLLELKRALDLENKIVRRSRSVMKNA